MSVETYSDIVFTDLASYYYVRRTGKDAGGTRAAKRCP